MNFLKSAILSSLLLGGIVPSSARAFGLDAGTSIKAVWILGVTSLSTYIAYESTKPTVKKDTNGKVQESTDEEKTKCAQGIIGGFVGGLFTGVLTACIPDAVTYLRAAEKEVEKKPKISLDNNLTSIKKEENKK